jgi:hypothetical protein
MRKNLFNSYVKQYDSTINEVLLETYLIKREMYHTWIFLFVCQLPAISKDKNTFVYIGARSYSHVIIDD